MPRKAPADIAARRRALIDLIATEEGLSLGELLERLPGRTARRTLHEDLAFLRTSFPDQVQRLGADGSHGTSRVTYRWQGAVPHLLDQPLTWLTESELLALIAARGLLHHDDQALPATSGTGKSIDGLASAAHRLIQRTGLVDTAQGLGRHVISVSRFGAAPVNGRALATCLTATASSQGLSFTYTNLDGVTMARVAAPQRLVLIRGEWYCIAWEDVLRMFRLARMTEVVISRRKPTGMPSHITTREVNELLAEGFYATGSLDRKRRRRVVLAVSPGAWPFIQGRTWGTSQHIDDIPGDLPTGWKRLTFTTTGLAECRHWVLGMGTGLRAEQPPELVEWLRGEAQDIAESYAKNP